MVKAFCFNAVLLIYSMGFTHNILRRINAVVIDIKIEMRAD
jgi:hypothetical protein